MMSPLKLSVIVCGAAAGLAVAPYVVKQILPPESSTEIASVDASADSDSTIKLDLPVQAPVAVSDSVEAPIEAIPIPTREEPPARPELHLPAPALPSPAPALPSPAPVAAMPISSAPELSLPSLAKPEIASAMPSPKVTPPPTPSPTPEIPYRSDVEKAQTLLRDLGMNTGKIDGKLGPNTQAAVRDFQKEQGLDVSGDVNSSLLARMEKEIAAKATPTPEAKVEITDSGKSDKSSTDKLSEDDPDTIMVRKSDSKPENKTEVASAAKKPKVDPGPVPTLQNVIDVKKLQTELKEAGTYDGIVDGKWGDLTRAAMREFQEKAGIEVTGKPNRETWRAMHEDDGEATAGKHSSSKAIASSDMKISTAGSEVSTSDEDDELVVSLNGDGVSNPDAAEPIATPATVSSLEKKTKSRAKKEVAGKSDVETPKVRVSTPDRDTEESSDASEVEPNDLAVAQGDSDSQVEEFRKEIETRRDRIKSVSNDSTYEVKKYAPKMLKTVNNMVDDLKVEIARNNPEEAKERLAKIDEELEKVKSESKKKKATQTVDGVSSSYKELKNTFPERIKSLSLKNEDEKHEREELTELVAKVDLGYEAMKKDFDKGEYDRIFKNGSDFRFTIDQINSKVAEVYVSSKIESSSIKKKLKDGQLDKIKSMQKDEKYLEAATSLDKAIASSDKD